MGEMCINSYGFYYSCSPLESCCGDHCCNNRVKIIGIVSAVIVVMLVLCRCLCPRRRQLTSDGNDRILVVDAVSPATVYGIQAPENRHYAHNAHNTNYPQHPSLPPTYPGYSVFQNPTVPTAQHPPSVPDSPPPSYSDAVSAPPPLYSTAVSNQQALKGEAKIAS